jgi:hypothetical protein
VLLPELLPDEAELLPELVLPPLVLDEEPELVDAGFCEAVPDPDEEELVLEPDCVPDEFPLLVFALEAGTVPELLSDVLV